jgi:UDP-glucose 4-epimerase
MKVLVTGGCGFIGSHIVDLLLKENHEVIIVDNFVTGHKRNVQHDVSIVDCDINDPLFEQVIADFRPNAIIHQAAQVSVPKSCQDMLYDEQVNIRGSLNVIEQAKKYDVQKIVFASSAAVYGNPQHLPIDVGHPVNPLSPYGVSKLAVEKYLQMAHSLYGIQYTILRYANVYGPRQDALGEGGVIAIFSEHLSKGQTPVIYGDGEQTRDFVYVEDVAKANVQALTYGDNQILNVSSGTKISINQLFKEMCQIEGLDIDPIYKEEREGDIRDSVLCNELTKKSLHWEPETSLRTGLEKTLNFYKNNDI